MRSILRVIVAAVLVALATIGAAPFAHARCVTLGIDSVGQTVCGLP